MKLDARLPLPPAVRQLPVHVGLYYSPEFLDYKKRIEFIGCGPQGRRDQYDTFYTFPIGEASRDLFDQVAAGLFRAVTVTPSPTLPAQSAWDVDGFLEPRIESFEWGMACTKEYFSTGSVFANVGMVFLLYDRDGRLLASLPVRGTAVEKLKLCWGKDCRDSLATEMAIKDAVARFLVSFAIQPEVNEWLTGCNTTPVRQPREH